MEKGRKIIVTVFIIILKRNTNKYLKNEMLDLYYIKVRTVMKVL